MSKCNTFSETVELAGVTIRINCAYSTVKRMCKAYVSKKCPAISITTTQKDIDFERARASNSCPDDYLETLAVYRKIAEAMPIYNTVLFHGSAIAVDGVGYLFTAKSGTGKSTHTRLWREMLDDKAIMVNDDKPLIRVTNDHAIAYGTPWDGKHHLSNNISVPMKAICIIERATENHIREIGFSEALPMLLQQVYRPMGTASMKKTLDLIDRLSHCVRFYRLGCNIDISAAELAYKMMAKS